MKENNKYEKQPPTINIKEFNDVRMADELDKVKFRLSDIEESVKKRDVEEIEYIDNCEIKLRVYAIDGWSGSHKVFSHDEISNISGIEAIEKLREFMINNKLGGFIGAKSFYDFLPTFKIRHGKSDAGKCIELIFTRGKEGRNYTIEAYIEQKKEGQGVMPEETEMEEAKMEQRKAA